MNFRQILPPDHLKSYVRYFWTLESACEPNSCRSFVPIPDGCPGIIFHKSENGCYLQEGHYKLPEIYLYGQTTGFSQINSFGSFKTIGVYFYPHAIKTIFSLPANEITNTCLSLELLNNRKFEELSDRLSHAETTDQQIAVLSAYLTELISRHNKGIDQVTQYALNKLIGSKGSMTLKDLQEDLRITERSFERRFNQFIGISPKLFSRVCRFQASLDQIRNNEYSKLTDVAFESGYADQSHFIRSFKEFTGFSPEQYQKQSSEVVENFPELIIK